MEKVGLTGNVVYIHVDKNLLAYMGKAKKLVRVIATTETGAISQYEPIDKPGNIFMPLIENGKNIEEFEILGEQLTLF